MGPNSIPITAVARNAKLILTNCKLIEYISSTIDIAMRSATLTRFTGFASSFADLPNIEKKLFIKTTSFYA